MRIVKWGERECFRINSGVRQGYIMSPWLSKSNKDAIMKEIKMRMGVRFLEEWREWKLPDFLYAGELVLSGESEQ